MLALWNAKRRNHEMASHRKEGPEHCSISTKLPNGKKFKTSPFQMLGRYKKNNRNDYYYML